MAAQAVVDETTKRATSETRVARGRIPRSIDELPAAARPYARELLERLTQGNPELRALYERLAASLAYLKNVLAGLASSHVCCVNTGQMFHYFRRELGYDAAALQLLIRYAGVNRTVKELEDHRAWLTLKEFEALFWAAVETIGTADAPYLLAREIVEYRFGVAQHLAQLMAQAASTVLGRLFLPEIVQKIMHEIENTMGAFNANKTAKVHTRSSPKNQAVVESKLKPELQIDPVTDDGWSQLAFVPEDIRMVPSIGTGQPGRGVPKIWKNLGLDLGPAEPDVVVASQQDPLKRLAFFHEWHRRVPGVGHELVWSHDHLTITVDGEITLRKVVVTKNDPWDLQVRLVTPFDTEFAHQSSVWLAVRTVDWGPDRTGGRVTVFRKGQLFGLDRMVLHLEWDIPPMSQRAQYARTEFAKELADLFAGEKRQLPAKISRAIWDGLTMKRVRQFNQEVAAEEKRIGALIEQIVRFINQHQEEFNNLWALSKQQQEKLLDAWEAQYEPAGESTTGHVSRVGWRAVAAARYLLRERPDLEEEIDLDALPVAGRVHDVGKILVRPEVLNKPTPYTPEESEEMAFHIIGTEIILDLLDYDPITYEIAVSHHEKFKKDKGGYPHNFNGAYLSLMAQLMGLADFFDALRSDRPYKKAFSREMSFDITTGAAKAGQFNKVLAHAFLRAMLTIDEPERPLSRAEEQCLEQLRIAIEEDGETLVFLRKRAVPEKVRKMKEASRHQAA